MTDQRTSCKDPAAPDDSIYVCSLVSVHDVLAETRARHLVTVINDQMMLATPDHLDSGNHLRIGCNDIDRHMPGLVPPSARQIADLIRFARQWDREGPLVIHCWAGISRSTAAAFVTACALNPKACEHDIARHLRAASATATPNRLIVALADELLGRNQRMVRAIDDIGQGEMAGVEARAFRIASRH